MENKRENRVDAPFTRKQVRNMNTYQKSGRGHPFTCGGAMCGSERPDGGTLVATEDGWMCPCGQYAQSWAWKAMTEDQPKANFRYFEFKLFGWTIEIVLRKFPKQVFIKKFNKKPEIPENYER